MTHREPRHPFCSVGFSQEGWEVGDTTKKRHTHIWQSHDIGIYSRFLSNNIPIFLLFCSLVTDHQHSKVSLFIFGLKSHGLSYFIVYLLSIYLLSIFIKINTDVLNRYDHLLQNGIRIHCVRDGTPVWCIFLQGGVRCLLSIGNNSSKERAISRSTKVPKQDATSRACLQIRRAAFRKQNTQSLFHISPHQENG